VLAGDECRRSGTGLWGAVPGMVFLSAGSHVARSAHPAGSWSSPRTASRAQLKAPARVARSVALRASLRVRALRPPQARRVKWRSCVPQWASLPCSAAAQATTGRPAPVPRLGTLPLTVPTACGPPSRSQADLSWPPLSGRQVLLFHASACDELTPPLHRAPPGQHAGRPLAEGTPPWRAFVPGALRTPGFDAIVPPIDASAVVHTRSSSRRPPDPLTAGLFPQRSPPRLLTGAACGGLGSPPARRTRRAKPPSLAQHGSCRRPSTSPSLSFQDTPQIGGYFAPCANRLCD
jgi:hypothetical protein